MARTRRRFALVLAPLALVLWLSAGLAGRAATRRPRAPAPLRSLAPPLRSLSLRPGPGAPGPGVGEWDRKQALADLAAARAEARARREAEERWLREVEADPEATPVERQKAHDRAFRAGAWQAPGDAIVQALTGATVSGDRSPAKALKSQGLAPGLHQALEAEAGRTGSP